MKVTKLPDDAYDADLFCDNDKTKLKSDCIAEESVRCPFCNAETDNILFCKKNAYSYFYSLKGVYVYTECKCEECGARWESDRHLMKSQNNVDVIHNQVYKKCRTLLKRNFLFI